jgi:3-oxoadipate enol-lactonase
MPFQSVGDIRLFYELIDYCEPWTRGPAPVVFIHGLGGSHEMWLYQVPAFCGRFPILTLDLRNHGTSGRTTDEFTIADMARDVARLLRAIGAERAHVVGLSLGGMVALQLALDHATVVASLTLADTMAGMPPDFEHLGREALRFIEESSMAEVAKTRITNAFSPDVNPVMRDYLIDQVAKNDKPAYVCAARAAFRFNVRDRLGAITTPTLVVVGDADIVTPPPLSEELAAGVRGARLVRIANAGHITSMERPAEFNAAVLEFVSAVP